jgi:hypothetical protein
MKKGKSGKLTLMGSQIIAFSDIWKGDFCFPVTIELGFQQMEGTQDIKLKGLNMIFDSPGSFTHIATHLGFRRYGYKSMQINAENGEVFKLPDLPISMTFSTDTIPDPIAVELSGWEPGHGH